MNKKQRFSIRNRIHNESYKKIGIRINCSTYWVDFVASYCRLSIMPVLQEMMDEFAETVNHTETFNEFFCKAIVSGSIAHAYLYKALHGEFQCGLPTDGWTISEDDLWFDEDLIEQLKFENYDCQHTMIVLDLETYKVTVI